MSIHFWKIIILLATIVVAFGIYKVWVLEKAEKELAAKKSALSGKLIPPKSVKPKAKDSVKLRSSKEIMEEMKREKIPKRRAELSKELRKTKGRELLSNENMIWLILGSNRIGEPKDFFKSGVAFDPVRFTGEVPIVIKVVNDSLKVSGFFRSLDGKVVAQIVDNEWEINPNNYFKRNYDDNGLEVIDQESILKFQVDFANNNTIVFNGFFKLGSNFVTATNEGYVTWSVNSSTREKIITESGKVPLMFQYPSDRHFGKRAQRQ